jgi:3-methylcrotonyl-CoA carboxylase alpha subunit
LPGSGRLVHLQTPKPSEFVRIDTGVRQGDEVTVYYDPMIAKLVTWGQNRDEALKRLYNALGDYRVIGLATNIAFLRRCASHPAFARAEVSTAFIEKYKNDLLVPHKTDELAVVLAALAVAARDQQKAINQANETADKQSPCT